MADSGPSGFGRSLVLPPLDTGGDLAQAQAEWRGTLAEGLYGPIPAAPDGIEVTRHPVPGEDAEHLRICISVGGRELFVDAALWLPPNRKAPAPLIGGLDFIGPAGILVGDGFALDPRAVIHTRAEFGARPGRMDDVLRGTSTYRWPVDLLRKAGYAVLVSCYGSWVPDDPAAWRTNGVYPLLDCGAGEPVGAISLWAWAIQRLLDAAQTLAEVDAAHLSVAGHSRLGKAALWAAANDRRIGAVFANDSGCGGAAPARHPVGETLAQMADHYPHWTVRNPQIAVPEVLEFDQHHLLACIAPRAVYLANARQDLWADPVGSYVALVAASRVWRLDVWPAPQEMWSADAPIRNGSLGYHIRPGAHDLLPYDWRQFLAFMA